MEHELVKGSSSTPLQEDNERGLDGDPSFSFKKRMQELCPFYMSIGMTYHEYWDEEVEMAKYYRDSWELKQRYDNQQLWLQGMYIYEALCDASPIFHDLAKKGTKPLPYAQEPYAITNKQVKEKKERDERMRYENIKANTIAWMERLQGKGDSE